MQKVQQQQHQQQQKQQQQPTVLIVQEPQPLSLAQWQADRICSAAEAANPAELAAALTAVGCAVDTAAPVFAPHAAAAAVANCRDSKRCLTPLHCAAAAIGSNDAEVASRVGDCAAMLLMIGANPNARDGHGCTPLHYAARYSSLAVCQRLLTCRSTRLDLRNTWGRTALMFAAWGGEEAFSVGGAGGNELKRLDIARALLASGANVDIRDCRGRTALMWAALTGKVGLLKLLLGSGADWRRRNFDGLTAAQLAQREGHIEVTRLLKVVAEEALKSPPPALNSPDGQDGANLLKDSAASGAETVNAGTGTA